MPPSDVRQHTTEPGLGRQRLTRGHREPGGHHHPWRPMATLCRLVERHRVQKCAQLRLPHVEPGERLPLVALGDAHLGPQRLDLGRRRQAGMVVLVPFERQPIALDRVGDEADRRLVVRGAAKRLPHRIQVVPREVGHQPVQRFVVMLVEQLADTRGVAQIPLQPGPPGRPALIGERRVGGIRTAVDPVAQRVAPTPCERRVEPSKEPVGHDRVETLAVVVDDPPDVADVVLPPFEQRLEDIPLVELGVTHHRNHASGRRVVGHEPSLAEERLGQCGEAGHGDTHADRPGRDIHVVQVLRARWVGLSAAEAAEPLELVARLGAEQILDGVIDRAPVGLGRHAVDRAQHIEIQRRHQRHHRRARYLVPTDFEPVSAGAHVVRVVDHPRAEPQHLLLEGRQTVPDIRCRRRDS